MSSEVRRRGVCLVVAAPSGAGKSSITRALLASERQLELSISATTRPPRPGESDGIHYHFRTPEAFAVMVAQGAMLEWASVFGNSYGTPRVPVEAALEAGRDVVFDIDWQGHRQLRAALPGDVVGLFILPPSHGELARRLTWRGDPADVVEARMALARAEMSHASEFDHILVNDEFDRALARMRAVLHAAQIATARQTGLAAFLAAMEG